MEFINNFRRRLSNTIKVVKNFIKDHQDKHQEIKSNLVLSDDKSTPKKSTVDHGQFNKKEKSPKRKGNVSTSTTTFNHPRRELDQYNKSN